MLGQRIPFLDPTEPELRVASEVLRTGLVAAARPSDTDVFYRLIPRYKEICRNRAKTGYAGIVRVRGQRG
jgi:hypothetical protein